MRLTVSPEAASDIESIVAYGTERWGYEAAEAYSRGLRHQIGDLPEHPLRYAEMENVGQGVRSFAHRRHRVFYIVDSDTVLIIRILHQQADWPRQIP